MATPIYLSVLFIGLFCPSLIAGAEDQSSPTLVRVPRGFKKRVCKKYGICEGQGGFGGGYGGAQGGYSGYQGYPPAINIGISQSQSSSSAGGGGYSNGYYPNNYQYNRGYPHYGGYGGYNGYHSQRPGFLGNSNGGYNNQFNGNYYAPSGIGQGGYGGFGNGFRPYDEQYGGVDHKPEYDDVHNDEANVSHDNYPQNYGAHEQGSFVGAYSGTYSHTGRSAKN